MSYTLLLLAASVTPNNDHDARAALALAAASKPKQPNTPPPCEYLPNCPCGCQQGGACTCGPKDGSSDGEWTYDAATKKWWKYVVDTTQTIPTPECTAVPGTPHVYHSACVPNLNHTVVGPAGWGGGRMTYQPVFSQPSFRSFGGYSGGGSNCGPSG